MAVTPKQKELNNAWQRKNYKRLGVKLYKGDAEAFEKYCRDNGRSVNAVFREFVSQCLGRPLEKRSEVAGKEEEAEIDAE